MVKEGRNNSKKDCQVGTKGAITIGMNARSLKALNRKIQEIDPEVTTNVELFTDGSVDSITWSRFGVESTVKVGRTIMYCKPTLSAKQVSYFARAIVQLLKASDIA